MHTPWGESQFSETHGEGITFYSTASHGGFKVSPDLNNRIPLYFRNASFNGQGLAGWYEEDCDAAIVIVVFAERFPASAVTESLNMLASYLPVEFQRFEATTLFRSLAVTRG